MQNPFYKTVTDGRILPAGGNYCGDASVRDSPYYSGDYR